MNRPIVVIVCGVALTLIIAIVPKRDQPAPSQKTFVATTSKEAKQPSKEQSTPDVAPPSKAAATSTQSRRAIVNSLAQSSSPKDAMAAFMRIEACQLYVKFDQEFSLVKIAERTADLIFKKKYFDAHRQEACGDLTENDMTQRRRISLLERAAEAGVPMAAIYLVREGPAGDPDAWVTRPQDPVVLEFNRRATELIKLAAAKGDEVSLFSLAEQYSTGIGVASEHNPEMGYMYAVAWVRLHATRTSEPLNNVILNQYANGLSADAIVRATEAGERLAAQALKG